MTEKSKTPVREAGVPEENGTTSTLSVTRHVKPTLRQRVNDKLFGDGLRLRGNNLVQIYSDGPLPRLYSTGHEPVFEFNVNLEQIAQSLGVFA